MSKYDDSWMDTSTDGAKSTVMNGLKKAGKVARIINFMHHFSKYVSPH